MERNPSVVPDIASRVCAAIVGFRANHGHWPSDLVIGRKDAAKLAVQLGSETFQHLKNRLRIHQVSGRTILALNRGPVRLASTPFPVANDDILELLLHSDHEKPHGYKAASRGR